MIYLLSNPHLLKYHPKGAVANSNNGSSVGGVYDFVVCVCGFVFSS